MNKKQLANLRKIQENLAALSDMEALAFDITSCSRCAWGMVVENGWLPGAPDWGCGAPEYMAVRLGLNTVDQQYLFQQLGGERPAATRYVDYAPPGRGAFLYPENLPAAEEIQECLCRIENVIQYHLSIGLEDDV